MADSLAREFRKLVGATLIHYNYFIHINLKFSKHPEEPFYQAGSPVSFLVAEKINLKLLSRTRRRSTRAAAAAVQNLNISALPHQHQILNI